MFGLKEAILKLIPHFDIVKTVDGEVLVYLRRYFLFRSRFGNIYLHQILRSDDDPDPHDHPWSFVSLILSGGYVDEGWKFIRKQGFNLQPLGEREPDSKHYRPTEGVSFDGWRFKRSDTWVQPRSIVHRRAEHIHRVILTNGIAWTLVFTGPEKRPWYFFRNGAQVFWREYLNAWGPRNAD